MSEKIKKPLWKKWWFWLLALIIVVIATNSNGGKTEENIASSNSNVVTKQGEDTNIEADKKEESKNQSTKNKIKAGTYKVGSDLEAGEYLFITKSMGYVEISSDSTGSLDSIISNDNVIGHTYITVNDGEYLKLQGGEAYIASGAPSVIPSDSIYKDGKYKVGQDIQAGEYKVTLTSDMGYIEVSSDSRGVLDSIVTNENVMADTYITVEDGQYLKLQGVEIKAN